jgi:tRNA nucleotidyltransferase (CCA-adding enzyme)
MIHFHNLDKISSHNHYLTTILGNKKFFFVGGMIRDLLLDRATNMDDVDITAWWTHEVLKTLIHNNTKKEFSFFDTEKYGTMTIIPKNQADTNIQYEITPFRTETTYSDGRHPDDVVRSDSLLEDSKRRDFTINCIYYTKIGNNTTTQKTEWKTIDDISLIKSLERNWWYYDTNSYTLILQNHDLIHTAQDNYQETINTLWIDNVVHLILDPHHGIQDLINKKIRAVGIPDRRFQEDALRVIRALRFSIALECDIEKHTRTSLQKNAYFIRQIAKERIKQECDKVFSGNNPFGFISLLDSANLLKWIFPKVYDNKWVNQPIRYHPFDVYTHTLMVLYHTQMLTTDKIVRYAALYHDVWKVEQYNTYNMKLDDQGIRDVFWWWLNHPVCGADFVKEDFKKLGTSNDEIDKISRYVRRHMKPWEILMWDKDHYKKKLRPLIAEVGSEMVKNVCLLTIGDRLGQYNPIQAPQIDEVYNLISLVDEIMSEEGRFTIKKLAIDGNVIIEELNIKPWPQIGKLLNQAYERVLEDLERNHKKILLDTIKQWIIQW